MKELNRRAFEGLLQLVVALVVLIFLPAWTIHYWQAWVFLAVFLVSTLAITLYLMEKDPKLLERRVKAGSAAEKEASQKIIQSIASIAFIFVIAFPAIDHRCGWSTVPTFVVVLGDVLVALGLLFVFFVFRENTYTSAVIEVDTEQKVISTGPYAIVRHPMYISASIMLVGVPLALGSFWGLLAVIPITITIVWRLLEEEVFLTNNLSGYAEYRSKVKYRLLPFVW